MQIRKNMSKNKDSLTDHFIFYEMCVNTCKLITWFKYQLNFYFIT